MDFLDNIDLTMIFGGVLVALFAGFLTGFMALFGWCLSKTWKNAKDCNVAHSVLRGQNDRIKRIEKYLNGGFLNGQDYSSQQDFLDGDNNRSGPSFPGGPDVDI